VHRGGLQARKRKWFCRLGRDLLATEHLIQAVKEGHEYIRDGKSDCGCSPEHPRQLQFGIPAFYRLTVVHHPKGKEEVCDR
jgi:hypothetical protein